MNLVALFSIIQKTIAKEGLKLFSLNNNSRTDCIFVLNNELQVKPVLNSSYTGYSGYCFRVRLCPANNGQEDVSYYVEIDQVERSSFGVYKRIKVSKHQSEKTIEKHITNLILEYKTMLKIEEVFSKIN